MSLLISNNLASSFCDLFVCFLAPSAAVDPLVAPEEEEEEDEETMEVLATLRICSWYLEEDKGGEAERATEAFGPGMM